MKHCESFERRLVSSIPYQVRHGIESTLQSFTASRVMLSVFQSAANCALAKSSMAGDATIAAFGSYGRLDGHTAVSDFDFIVLYPGDPNGSVVQEIQDLIRSLVSSNQCLLFDHRDQIEAGTFDFGKSPAYPVLSEAELLADVTNIRAVQLLSEGRIICGEVHGAALRRKILGACGFSGNATLIDLSRLRQALEGFKHSYCCGVMCRKRDDGWELSNRKALKVFALREFSYIASMFAVAEAALAVAVGVGSEETAIELISSPSVLKIASFASPRGALAQALEMVGLPLRNEAVRRLKTHAERASDVDRLMGLNVAADPGQGEVNSHVRALALPVIVKYDALLALLHDAEFMKKIDGFEPDITTWIGHRSFQRILSYRSEMIAGAVRLATALLDVLDLLEGGNHQIVADAKCALEAIKNYKLHEATGL